MGRILLEAMGVWLVEFVHAGLEAVGLELYTPNNAAPDLRLNRSLNK